MKQEIILLHSSDIPFTGETYPINISLYIVNSIFFIKLAIFLLIIIIILWNIEALYGMCAVHVETNIYGSWFNNPLNHIKLCAY